MGMSLIHPSTLPRGPRRAEVLRNIRDQLPVAKYLEILHCLAMTGQVPVYAPSNTGRHQPTGEFTEPDRRAQREVLVYLTDTALEPLKAEKAPADTSTIDAAAFITNSRNMSLLDLMHGAKGITPPKDTNGPPKPPDAADAPEDPTTDPE